MDNSSVTLFPSPPFQVSEEQFRAFHSNDRKLYQILVDQLDRDPSESMNVMAFWMWLERDVCVKVNLIHKLIDYPYNLVNEVAEESVVCLLCCQFKELPIHETVYELAVLPNLVHPNVVAKKLGLHDFHENRISVMFNVKKLVNNVCFRAFKDLVPRKPCRPNSLYPGQTNISIEKGKAACDDYFDGFSCDLPVNQAPLFFGQIAASPAAVNAQEIIAGLQMPHAINPPLPVMDDLVGNALGNLRVSNVDDEAKDKVLPDDRTIFITFSKGYPVSEAEVREFFTRGFGNFIESVYMQDVPPYEQVLYGRIVSRSAAIVDLVVQGGRAKYNISGKHVWTRKYMKKKPTTD